MFQRGFGFTSSTPHHKVTNKVTSEAPERENRDDVTKSSIVDRISGAILQNLEKSLNTDCRINSSGLSGNNSISIDLNHSETNVYRRYVLTKKMKYETFENFLHTELKAKRLFYALDPKERSKVETIKLTNDDVKIKDIIINHIHEDYNEKLSHMNNPIDLLDEIKRIKTQEIGLTKHIAYKNLINIRFDKEKESGFDFCARFDETVRTYEAHMKGEKYPEEEKRSLFFNAVRKSVPAVVTADCLADSDSNVCNLTKLRKLVLQLAPKVINKSPSNSSAMNVQPQGPNRCYSCGSKNHDSGKCPDPNVKCCYKCDKTGHLQRNCPLNVPGIKFVTKRPSSETSTPHSNQNAKRPRSESRQPESSQQGQSPRSGTRAYQNAGGRAPASHGAQGKRKIPKKIKCHLADCTQCDDSESDTDNNEDTSTQLDNFIADSGASDHIANQ